MSTSKAPSLGSVVFLNAVVAVLLATRASARWNILVYAMLGEDGNYCTVILMDTVIMPVVLDIPDRSSIDNSDF